MKTKVRETSLLAYSEKLETIGEMQSEVYRVIRNFNNGCNNKMIAKYMKLPINSITGRVNELRKRGLVIEDRKDICPITLETEGKTRMTLFWKVRRRL